MYSFLLEIYLPTISLKLSLTKKLSVKTHRLIITSSSDSNIRFEIHFDQLVNNIEPITRGFFSKRLYKIKFVYPTLVFEIKNYNRGDISDIFNEIKKAFIDSKNSVI